MGTKFWKSTSFNKWAKNKVAKNRAPAAPTPPPPLAQRPAAPPVYRDAPFLYNRMAQAMRGPNRLEQEAPEPEKPRVLPLGMRGQGGAFRTPTQTRLDTESVRPSVATGPARAARLFATPLPGRRRPSGKGMGGVLRMYTHPLPEPEAPPEVREAGTTVLTEDQLTMDQYLSAQSQDATTRVGRRQVLDFGFGETFKRLNEAQDAIALANRLRDQGEISWGEATKRIVGTIYDFWRGQFFPGDQMERVWVPYTDPVTGERTEEPADVRSRPPIGRAFSSLWLLPKGKLGIARDEYVPGLDLVGYALNALWTTGKQALKLPFAQWGPIFSAERRFKPDIDPQNSTWDYYRQIQAWQAANVANVLEPVGEAWMDGVRYVRDLIGQYPTVAQTYRGPEGLETRRALIEAGIPRDKWKGIIVAPMTEEFGGTNVDLLPENLRKPVERMTEAEKDELADAIFNVQAIIPLPEYRYWVNKIEEQYPELTPEQVRAEAVRLSWDIPASKPLPPSVASGLAKVYEAFQYYALVMNKPMRIYDQDGWAAEAKAALDAPGGDDIAQEALAKLNAGLRELSDWFLQVNPDFSYTWMIDPEAEAEYYDAKTVVEAQLDRPLGMWEIVRLKERYEDPVAEMIGEATFDLSYIAPFSKLWEGAVKGAWGMLKVGGQIAGRVAMKVPMLGDAVRWLTRETTISMARRVGFHAAEVFGTIFQSVRSTDDWIKAIHDFGQLRRIPVTMGNRQIKLADELARLIPIDEWERLADRAIERATAKTKELFVQRGITDPDVLKRIRPEPRLVVQELASAFEARMLDAGRAARGTAEAPQLVSSFQRFWNSVMPWWIEQILSARPGFTVINFLDSGFRMLLYGGDPFSDIEEILRRTPFERELLMRFPVTEAQAALPLPTNPGLGPLGYFLQRSGTSTLSDWPWPIGGRPFWTLKKEAREAFETAHPLITKIMQTLNWGNWGAAWKQYNAWFEFAMSVRLYDSLFWRRFLPLDREVGEKLILQLMGQGASPEAVAGARQVWMAAGHNPAMLRELASEYLMGTTVQGKPLWSWLIPPQFESWLAGMPPEMQTSFRELVLNRIRPVMAKADWTPEALREAMNAALDDFVKNWSGAAAAQSGDTVVTGRGAVRPDGPSRAGSPGVASGRTFVDSTDTGKTVLHPLVTRFLDRGMVAGDYTGPLAIARALSGGADPSRDMIKLVQDALLADNGFIIRNADGTFRLNDELSRQLNDEVARRRGPTPPPPAEPPPAAPTGPGPTTAGPAPAAPPPSGPAPAAPPPAGAAPAGGTNRITYTLGKELVPAEVERRNVTIIITSQDAEGRVWISLNINGAPAKWNVGGAKWLGRSTEDPSHHLFELPGAATAEVNGVERSSRRVWVQEKDLPPRVLDEIKKALGEEGAPPVRPPAPAGAAPAETPRIQTFSYAQGVTLSGEPGDAVEVRFTRDRILITSDDVPLRIKTSSNWRGVVEERIMGGAKWLGESTEHPGWHIFELPGGGVGDVNGVRRARLRFWVEEKDLPTRVLDEIKKALGGAEAPPVRPPEPTPPPRPPEADPKRIDDLTQTGADPDAAAKQAEAEAQAARDAQQAATGTRTEVVSYAVGNAEHRVERPVNVGPWYVPEDPGHVTIAQRDGLDRGSILQSPVDLTGAKWLGRSPENHQFHLFELKGPHVTVASNDPVRANNRWWVHEHFLDPATRNYVDNIFTAPGGYVERPDALSREGRRAALIDMEHDWDHLNAAKAPGAVEAAEAAKRARTAMAKAADAIDRASAIDPRIGLGIAGVFYDDLSRLRGHVFEWLRYEILGPDDVGAYFRGGKENWTKYFLMQEQIYLASERMADELAVLVEAGRASEIERLSVARFMEQVGLPLRLDPQGRLIAIVDANSIWRQTPITIKESLDNFESMVYRGNTPRNYPFTAPYPGRKVPFVPGPEDTPPVPPSAGPTPPPTPPPAEPPPSQPRPTEPAPPAPAAPGPVKGENWEMGQVTLADLKRHPKFQERDTAGNVLQVDPERVEHIAQNWDPRQYEPIKVNVVGQDAAKYGKGYAPGDLVLMSGHHRSAAALARGMTDLPAQVYHLPFEEAEYLARTANMARQAQTAYEDARVVRDLIAIGITEQEIAVTLYNNPKKAAYVGKLATLTSLSPDVGKMVGRYGWFTDEHGFALAAAVRQYNINPEMQQQIVVAYMTEYQPSVNQLTQFLKYFGPKIERNVQVGFWLQDTSLLAPFWKMQQEIKAMAGSVATAQRVIKNPELAEKLGIDLERARAVVAEMKAKMAELERLAGLDPGIPHTMRQVETAPPPKPSAVPKAPPPPSYAVPPDIQPTTFKVGDVVRIGQREGVALGASDFLRYVPEHLRDQEYTILDGPAPSRRHDIGGGPPDNVWLVEAPNPDGTRSLTWIHESYFQRPEAAAVVPPSVPERPRIDHPGFARLQYDEATSTYKGAENLSRQEITEMLEQVKAARAGASGNALARLSNMQSLLEQALKKLPEDLEIVNLEPVREALVERARDIYDEDDVIFWRISSAPETGKYGGHLGVALGKEGEYIRIGFENGEEELFFRRQLEEATGWDWETEQLMADLARARGEEFMGTARGSVWGRGGPPGTKPRRTFRSGPYTNEIIFVSRAQQDLEMLGRQLRKLTRGDYEKFGSIGLKAAHQQIDEATISLSRSLGLSAEQTQKLARDVADDISNQVKGLKDETLQLVDNVGIPDSTRTAVVVPQSAGDGFTVTPKRAREELGEFYGTYDNWVKSKVADGQTPTMAAQRPYDTLVDLYTANQKAWAEQLIDLPANTPVKPADVARRTGYYVMFSSKGGPLVPSRIDIMEFMRYLGASTGRGDIVVDDIVRAFAADNGLPLIQDIPRSQAKRIQVAHDLIWTDIQTYMVPPNVRVAFGRERLAMQAVNNAIGRADESVVAKLLGDQLAATAAFDKAAKEAGLDSVQVRVNLANHDPEELMRLARKELEDAEAARNAQQSAARGASRPRQVDPSARTAPAGDAAPTVAESEGMGEIGPDTALSRAEGRPVPRQSHTPDAGGGHAPGRKTQGGVVTISSEHLPQPAEYVAQDYLDQHYKRTLDYFIGQGLSPDEAAKKAFQFMEHQVDNANRALSAFDRAQAFIIADGTGTGKTFSGALIVDQVIARRSDAPARVLIVTKNAELIRQWGEVLNPMGIDIVKLDGKTPIPNVILTQNRATVFASTYANMLNWNRDASLLEMVGDNTLDLVIFDESHALKNWYQNVDTALAGYDLAGLASHQLFMSATPMESPLHAGYFLRDSRVFSSFDDMLGFLKIEKVQKYDRHGRPITTARGESFFWKGISPYKLADLHAELVRRGVLIRHEISFRDMIDRLGEARFMWSASVPVPITRQIASDYATLNRICDQIVADLTKEGSGRNAMNINAQRVAIGRSLLENGKIPIALDLAEAKLREGKSVALFVWRKEGTLFEEHLIEWMNGTRTYSKNSGLPALYQALVDAGIGTTSPIDLVRQRFPDAVEISGRRTDKEVAEAIRAFQSGDARIVVATIDKGGTGLSLHDTIGGHARVQINLTVPYTALGVDQTAGRTFRMGSQSHAELYWLYNPTKLETKYTRRTMGLMERMGALLSGPDGIKISDNEMTEFLFAIDDETVSAPLEAVEDLLASATDGPALPLDAQRITPPWDRTGWEPVYSAERMAAEAEKQRPVPLPPEQPVLKPGPSEFAPMVDDEGVYYGAQSVEEALEVLADDPDRLEMAQDLADEIEELDLMAADPKTPKKQQAAAAVARDTKLQQIQDLVTEHELDRGRGPSLPMQTVDEAADEDVLLDDIDADDDRYDIRRRYVPPDFAIPKYSADKLAEDKVRAVAAVEGEEGLWINTGGTQDLTRYSSQVNLHRVVPIEEWTGPTPVSSREALERPRQGEWAPASYEGQKFTFRKKEYVITRDVLELHGTAYTTSREFFEAGHQRLWRPEWDPETINLDEIDWYRQPARAKSVKSNPVAIEGVGGKWVHGFYNDGEAMLMEVVPRAEWTGETIRPNDKAISNRYGTEFATSRAGVLVTDDAGGEWVVTGKTLWIDWADWEMPDEVRAVIMDANASPVTVTMADSDHDMRFFDQAYGVAQIVETPAGPYRIWKAPNGDLVALQPFDVAEEVAKNPPPSVFEVPPEARPANGPQPTVVATEAGPQISMFGEVIEPSKTAFLTEQVHRDAFRNWAITNGYIDRFGEEAGDHQWLIRQLERDRQVIQDSIARGVSEMALPGAPGADLRRVPAQTALDEIQAVINEVEAAAQTIKYNIGTQPTLLGGGVIPFYSLGFIPDLLKPLGIRVQQTARLDRVAQLTTARRAIDNWYDFIINEGSLMLHAAPEADKVAIAAWADMAVKAKAEVRDVAIRGTDGVPSLAFVEGRIEGALNETLKVMIDYATEFNIDRIFKTIYPFWKFPSRSIPFWIETATMHPELVAFYYKYQQMSERYMYQRGATDSEGRPLNRFRGYIPLPGTDLWWNPLAPLSAKVVMPMERNVYQDPRDEFGDRGPLETVINVAYRWSTQIGLNMPPWYVHMLRSTGMIDRSEFPARTLVPIIDLIPPWKQYALIEHLRKLHLWPENWGSYLSPQVTWKDFLVERELLAMRLQAVREAPEAEKAATALAAETALIEREGNFVWDQAQRKVEEGEYYRALVGFFTGIYAKEYSDAEAELRRLRNEINFLKDMINDDVGATIFGLPEERSAREQMWKDKRYAVDEGVIYGLFSKISWTQTPTEGSLDGPRRREYLAGQITKDIQRRDKFKMLDIAYDELQAGLQSLPVGAPYELKEKFYADYARQVALAETSLWYSLVRSGPDQPGAGWDAGKWETWFTESLYRMILSTKPRYQKGDETYTEYEARLEVWKKDIPMIAAKILPEFKREATTLPPDAVWPKNLLAQASWTLIDKWDLANDSAVEALNRVWEDQYWSSYWDAVEGKEGYARDVAEMKWRLSWPVAPNEATLIRWVEQLYGNRFSAEELRKIINSGVMDVEQRLQSTMTEEDKQAEAVWNWMSWVGPNKDALEKAFFAQGGDPRDWERWWSSDGDPSAWKDTEEWTRFYGQISVAAMGLSLMEPNIETLEEWSAAQELHNAYKDMARATFGANIFILSAQYASLSRADKEDFRKQYPYITEFWDFRDWYAAENPLWAKYYNPNASTAGGGGGGGGGGKSGGGSRRNAAGARRASTSLPLVPSLGYRSSLNIYDILEKGPGRGKSTRLVNWPKELQKAAAPELIEEVEEAAQKGTKISKAAADYLASLAGKYPSSAPFVADLQKAYNPDPYGGAGDLQGTPPGGMKVFGSRR